MAANSPAPQIEASAFLLLSAWHVVDGASTLTAFNVCLLDLGNHVVRYKVFAIWRGQPKLAYRYTFGSWDDAAAFLRAACPRTYAQAYFASGLPPESRYPVAEKDIAALGGAISISATDIQSLKLIAVRDGDYAAITQRVAAFERQKRAITVDNFLRNLPVAC